GDAPLRRPLEVESFREAPRVERVVVDRDLLVEDLLAQASCRVASLFYEGEAAEGLVREELEQFPQRVRLQHGPVRSGLELLGATRALGLGNRLLRRGRGIDRAGGPA